MNGPANENAPAVPGRGVGSFAQVFAETLPSHDSAPTAAITSREIANLLGRRHDSVKRAIGRLVEAGAIIQPPLVDEHGVDAKGRPRATQVLYFAGEQGKRDSIVAVAQLSPQFTAVLVDRWAELETVLARQRNMSTLPHFADPAAAARAWADEHDAKTIAQARVAELSHRVNRQAEVIECQRPAADFVARFVDAAGTRSIREVAKHCGAKETEFVHWLVDTRVLFRHHENGRLLPMAEHQHVGRFVMKAGISGEGRIWSQARFTAKGVAWIAARWVQKKAADAAGGAS